MLDCRETSTGKAKNALPDIEVPWGAFGENFTTEGISENQVHIRDRLQIGSSEFVVTQPRMPCFKLGIRSNDMKMVSQTPLGCRCLPLHE
jgi:MOSC domain-containing protein YiiM